MQLLAGTSGFSYKEWCGEFYPAKLPARAMLEHYSRRLPTVEINNTFYRLPNVETVRGWRSQVPATFRFAVKMPRRVTHLKRLKDCAAEVDALLRSLEALTPCLGPLLVQLPPYFKCDPAVLATFIDAWPANSAAAFEFRHESWLNPEIYRLLEARNLALVQSESAAGFEPLPWTADWAYLRLRRVDYAERDLGLWLERLRASRVESAYVFFKHEDAATGPKLAARLLDLYSGA
jgi:uncharacterized protein YecE (DUF72 family)